MNNLRRFLGIRCVTNNIISEAINLSTHSPRTQLTSLRLYSDEKKASDAKFANPVVGSRYEKYTEENAPIILDVEEERERIKQGYTTEIPQSSTGLDLFEGMNLNRKLNSKYGLLRFVIKIDFVIGGVRGVFEIEDLVEVLRRDNVDDIFVCKVPEQLKYVDYLCVITGRSTRHMKAIIEFVLKLYKLKCSEKDRMPRVEGKSSSEWIALDLGNIALHVFSEEARVKYDLETLWSVGPEFDSEMNKPSDPLLEMFERSMFLSDLTPDNEEEVDTSKT